MKTLFPTLLSRPAIPVLPSIAISLALLLPMVLLHPTTTHAQSGSGAKRSGPVRGDAAYATREDAMQFADDVATRRNLDREWVRATIGRARFLPNVPRLMLPPARGTAKNWNAYRGRFIDPVRVAAGVRFWRANADTLARA